MRKYKSDKYGDLKLCSNDMIDRYSGLEYSQRNDTKDVTIKDKC